MSIFLYVVYVTKSLVPKNTIVNIMVAVAT